MRIKTGVITQMFISRNQDKAVVGTTIDRDLGNARSAPFRWIDHPRLFATDTFSTFVIKLANKPAGLERSDVLPPRQGPPYGPFGPRGPFWPF